MTEFFAVIAMAIFIEGIVTYFKELTQEFHIGYVAPILVGIVVAVAYNLDIPAILGIVAQVPYIGQVMTGIILARGSNYLYDFLSKITGGE